MVGGRGTVKSGGFFVEESQTSGCESALKKGGRAGRTSMEGDASIGETKPKRVRLILRNFPCRGECAHAQNVCSCLRVRACVRASACVRACECVRACVRA
eukprot:110855-Pleurochrysis_carterae.AAC.1